MESKIILVLKIFLISLVLGLTIHKIMDSLVQKEIDEVEILQEDTLQAPEEEENVLGEDVRIVTATYYHPVPEQCDSDPLTTASGKKIDLEKLERGEIKWIAVSRDLLGTYEFGDIVKITCEHDPSINGEYEVTDTMNERFENTIDLLWHTSKKGKGKWKNVQISKVTD